MLDQRDLKILKLLDADARMSNAQIGRAVRLSKPAVEHRIQRLIDNGIISQFSAVIDFTKLGYYQYKLYLKLQAASLADEQKMIGAWGKVSNVVWVASLRGNFDLAVSILARDNAEFAQIANGLLDPFATLVQHKELLLTEYSPVYDRSGKQRLVYGKDTGRYELDEAEISILRAISIDARQSIIGIMEKTGLTREMVTYRLKRMRTAGVIRQFTCTIDPKAMGKHLYKVALHLGGNAARITAFADRSEQATQLLKLIGAWDAELEVECSDEQLHFIIADIRQQVQPRDMQIIQVVKTYKYDYFPF